LSRRPALHDAPGVAGITEEAGAAHVPLREDERPDDGPQAAASRDSRRV